MGRETTSRAGKIVDAIGPEMAGQSFPGKPLNLSHHNPLISTRAPGRSRSLLLDLAGQPEPACIKGEACGNGLAQRLALLAIQRNVGEAVAPKVDLHPRDAGSAGVLKRAHHVLSRFRKSPLARQQDCPGAEEISS